MEQTLGKRISTARKNLGWTQDQLAEKLGVTAQAVSKWENDQSCPDITMLPRLAELFGTTTDALLGITQEPVKEAEPVQEEPQEGLHFKTGNFEFRYDNSRKGGIVFGLWVLICGVLHLASTWFVWDLDLWTILWTTGLMFLGLWGLTLPKHSIFLCLAGFFTGAYFLLVRIVPLPFDIGSYVVPVLLILYGISLVVHAITKPHKPLFAITHNGKEFDSDHPQSDFSTGKDRFHFSASFGEQTRRIDLPLLRRGEINTSFGDYTVDLSGVESLAEACVLDVSCSFGNLDILVPSRFRVLGDSSTSFGAQEFQGQPDAETEGTIRLNGSVNFGNLCIRYI